MSVKTDYGPPPAVDEEVQPVPTVQSLKPRRRPWLVLAGLALTATCGVVAAMLYLSADERTPVVALARDVAYGQELTEQDLVSVRAALDPHIEALPAEQIPQVAGQRAAADLHQGQLLTSAGISGTGPPAPGHQLVTVPLGPDQMPAQGLEAGQTVDLVTTPGDGGEPPETAPAGIPARITQVGPPDTHGASVVDVEVAATDGAALAARVATGNIAVVVNPVEE